MCAPPGNNPKSTSGDFYFNGSFPLSPPQGWERGVGKRRRLRQKEHPRVEGRHAVVRTQGLSVQGQLVTSFGPLSAFSSCPCVISSAVWARPLEHARGRERAVERKALARPRILVPKLWCSGLLLSRALNLQRRKPNHQPSKAGNWLH